MTREEQIKKQADIYTDDASNYAEWCEGGGWVDINDIELIEKAYISGAEWADETMLTKACQWFENYLFDIGYPDDWCRDSPNMESGKERFIKAMKGE